jgi:choline dehydrogenase-like flavoprotein
MRFDRMAANMIRAYLFGTGPGTVVPGGLHAFIKTRNELAVPDIEFMFRGTAVHPHLWFPAIRPAYRDGFAIRPTLLHPDSRGEILLRSADPRDPMCIAYNFFSAPNDLPNLRQGFRLARDIAYQKPLDAFRDTESAPGANVKTDADIDAYIRRTAITSGRDLPDGPRSRRRARPRDARARHRAPARGRCLGHAGPRFGPPQRRRVDDGRKGCRYDRGESVSLIPPRNRGRASLRWKFIPGSG